MNSQPSVAAHSADDPFLEGVNTEDLTPRERQDWFKLVDALPAPCSNEATTVAGCVREKRACGACLSAAQLMVKAVRDGRTGKQCEAIYRARFAADRVKNFELQDSPTQGPASAPITIVEFADFECPFCAMAVPIVDKLMKDFSPNVRLVFKSYPIASHRNGELTARAGIAASNQGKFWEMHHKMFEMQSDLGRSSLEAIAKQLGLDVPKFLVDLDSPETADRMKRQRDQGNAAGVSGTPAFFINGRPFDFKLFDFGSSDLPDWIRLELKLLETSPQTK
jgi:protein-disulfide isomerase